MSSSTEDVNTTKRRKILLFGGMLLAGVLMVLAVLYLAQRQGLIGTQSNELDAAIQVRSDGASPITIPKGTSRKDAIRTLTVEAISLSNSGKKDEATDLFKQIDALAGTNYDDAEPFISAAMHYIELKNDEEAKEALKKARSAANRSGDQKEFYLGAIESLEENL